MPAPIITFHEISGLPIQGSQEYGTVDAGNASPTLTFDIWNAQGVGGTSTATNVSITAKTVNGLDTGDEVFNGQEIVSGLWLQVAEVNDNGIASEAPYSTEDGVGGATAKALHDLEPDSFIRVSTKLDIPASATAGPTNFQIVVSYQYI